MQRIHVKFLLSFNLYLCCFAAGTAQNIRLNLNERAEDGQFSKLVLATPVFYFNHDSVANPIDISAATKDDKVELRKVILPVFDPNYRAGYTWVFNGAAPGGFFKNHTLIGIQNPAWTQYATIIYTDKNHNLNLTDDGAPDTLFKGKGVFVNLGNSINPYRIYLEHFPFEKFPLFCTLNDADIEKVRGPRRFFGTSGSLRQKRLNVLAGRWNNGEDSFSFSLKDVNCNGRYNDPGIDVAMIADYREQFNNLQAVTIGNQSKAYLEWNNCAYGLTGADADGRYADLQRNCNATLKNALNRGQKLPPFKYCTASKPQKRQAIRKFKASYTYIYLWREAADEFISDSAVLHWMGNHQNKNFKVIALNYGASGRFVYHYNGYYSTKINQGFCSNQIIKKLKTHKLPTGILIDKRQRIIAVGIRPEKAVSLLKSLSVI
jgi:hypothetical protein